MTARPPRRHDPLPLDHTLTVDAEAYAAVRGIAVGGDTWDHQLVRYVSPFGSPAWMAPAQAAQLLADDDARWLTYQAAGVLSDHQRAIGPPRIERPAR